MREKYNIHVVTEVPEDGEFVVLVAPEDTGRWSNESFLYLPLPYMEQSLKLAAGMLLNNEGIAQNYLNGFYNILLGRKLTDDEVSMLFHKPWWILPEITMLAHDLSILHDAISQLEKSA